MSDKASEDLSYSFATIDQIYDDGITLIFDGEETASEKHYKCNSFCIFAPGQRVRVIKDSGTYVVEYPVGNPNADAILPAGGSDGQMLVKSGSANYALKWADAPENHIPTGGNVGQALIKASTSNYALEWGSPTVSRLYQGTTNYAELNSSRAFVPHTAGSRTYPYYLGTSSVPWYGIYTGDGASRICGSSGTLGFYGQTPIARQTLSLSSNNMSYTSVTANNYLYALNNLIGILKNKLGLIK